MDYFMWVEATRIEKPASIKLDNVRIVDLSEIAKEIKVVKLSKEELITVKATTFSR
jgi:hypothetical protein